MATNVSFALRTSRVTWSTQFFDYKWILQPLLKHRGGERDPHSCCGCDDNRCKALATLKELFQRPQLPDTVALKVNFLRRLPNTDWLTDVDALRTRNLLPQMRTATTTTTTHSQRYKCTRTLAFCGAIEEKTFQSEFVIFSASHLTLSSE